LVVAVAKQIKWLPDTQADKTEHHHQGFPLQQWRQHLWPLWMQITHSQSVFHSRVQQW